MISVHQQSQRPEAGHPSRHHIRLQHSEHRHGISSPSLPLCLHWGPTVQGEILHVHRLIQDDRS